MGWEEKESGSVVIIVVYYYIAISSCILQSKYRQASLLESFPVDLE